jgi:hypothetical protein
MSRLAYIESGIAACMALAASASAIAWLIKSSEHPDRPPMFAIAALLFAIAAGATGLVLGVRTAKGMTRASREGSPPRYQLVVAGALVAAICVCVLAWYLADQVYGTGDRMFGYVIGIAGSALPLVVLVISRYWLAAQPDVTQTASTLRWVRALLWVSALFLVVLLLFPFM